MQLRPAIRPPVQFSFSIARGSLCEDPFTNPAPRTVSLLSEPTWLVFLALAVGAILLGLLIHSVLLFLLARLGKRSETLGFFDRHVLRHVRAPLRLLFPLAALAAVVPWLDGDLGPGTSTVVHDVLYILLVVATAWLLIALTSSLKSIVAERFDVTAEDNLTARRVVTQVEILRRVVALFIVLVALAAILLHYDRFRELGTGLLASAGVAGIIIGFAAQRTLGNLLAGFQIAMTQPIRVDDVVIVEGEWGRIEEITLTYVIVRIWDERRLVVPISHFIEKPFQNWTRTSSDLLGTAFFYVDYAVPVDAVREELDRILNASTSWDGRVGKVQVTDVRERTVEVRVLISAADAGSAFELRCEVREKMIAFLRREYPGSLPRTRTEVTSFPEAETPPLHGE